MTVSFERKVLDSEYPAAGRRTVIKMCGCYFAHGRIYLNLYKNNSGFQYDFCTGMPGVKSFLIED